MSFQPVSVKYAHLKPEVLFDKPYGLVLYYREINVLYSEVIGKFTHAEYKHLYSELLGMIKTNKPHGLVASQRRSNGSSMQDRAWLVGIWFLQLKEVVGSNFAIAGLKEQQEDQYFKRFIADYLEKTVSTLVPFQVKSFPDFDSGVDFVLQARAV
ncbi:hypothetical protein [Rhodoflexus sp.]